MVFRYIYTVGGDDDPRRRRHWCCRPFCWCYLYREKKTNMHTVMNTFISALFFFFFFFYSFCKLLSSQASSSFVFGINFFVYVCIFFFFFFLLNVFTGLLFVCTYLYKIYIDALKSLKCLKCIIHTKTKNLLPTGFPLMCLFLFFFILIYSFTVFFQVFGLFVCVLWWVQVFCKTSQNHLFHLNWTTVSCRREENVPVLIYCKAENVYALLYRESIVRKYYGHMRSHM